MGESAAHIKLVDMMAEWVSKKYLEGDKGIILLDSPASSSEMKPPIIYNFVPDLYVPALGDDFLIIGEAKTFKDVENKHTEEQIKAFLRRCAEVPKAYFIMAVPWHMTALAISIIKYCKKEVGNLSHIEIEVPAIFPG